MGILLDEFDFLIEEEKETTFEEDSTFLVNEAKTFISKSEQMPDRTYQGIPVKGICDCISIGKTDIMPWEHVTFTLDFEKIRCIGKKKLEDFTIPPFVEEVRSIDNNDNNKFWCNQALHNSIRHLIISKNVIAIAPNTFSFFTNLENIKFEKDSKLIIIGPGAFSFCNKLHKLDLRKCIELDELPSRLLCGTAVDVLKITKNIETMHSDTLLDSSVKNVVVDKDNYNIWDFEERIKRNDYKAFWKKEVSIYDF